MMCPIRRKYVELLFFDIKERSFSVTVAEDRKFVPWNPDDVRTVTTGQIIYRLECGPRVRRGVKSFEIGKVANGEIYPVKTPS